MMASEWQESGGQTSRLEHRVLIGARSRVPVGYGHYHCWEESTLIPAEMAELADAVVSKTIGSSPMGVRVPLSAPSDAPVVEQRLRVSLMRPGNRLFVLRSPSR